MTLMGPHFLTGYYQSIIEAPVGLLFVAENDAGEVLGFVSGFESPSAFYEFFRGRKLRLAFSSLFYVLFRPRLWSRILENVSTVNRTASGEAEAERDSAELSSIAVSSEVEGGGCGRALVEEFIARCQKSGLAAVVLNTDALDNERVNRFYQRLGFVKVRTFERAQGRLMNQYKIYI